MFALVMVCTTCAPLPEPVLLDGTCTATDGDTIRCGEERIRLLGIDAPEKPGACREGRRCVDGDPAAASGSLSAAMQSGPLRIIRVGQDRFRRTLGSVFAGDVNLSCHQLEAGQAIYRRDWDDGRMIEKTCPSLTAAPLP